MIRLCQEASARQAGNGWRVKCFELPALRPPAAKQIRHGETTARLAKLGGTVMKMRVSLVLLGVVMLWGGGGFGAAVNRSWDIGGIW